MVTCAKCGEMARTHRDGTARYPLQHLTPTLHRFVPVYTLSPFVARAMRGELQVKVIR
jgi:hypothetical protein